ncbi:MAG: hypothetical protein ACR2LJ_12080 [Acidimicrobiales bacterium]
MSSLAQLCEDLFLLGHAHLAAGVVADGAGFERRVRAHLDAMGLPNARGFRVLGRRSISGLYHQLDEQTQCTDALVIGEWKAYSGVIPKNELLRFKAATDDYWLAGAAASPIPVVRVFGGTGYMTDAMRTYAAQSGIILITPGRWPVPTLCDADLLWSPGELEPPTAVDRRTLASLVRPMGAVLAPQGDGSWRIPPMAGPADVAARLRLSDAWSDTAWTWWDDVSPARFEALVEARTNRALALAA